MNAAVVHEYGAKPVYESFAEPAAGEGELIVQVTAAGLHPLVKAVAGGKHYGSTGALPLVPGVDGVGRTPDGKRVYFGIARAPYGSIAERTVVKKDNALELPDGLDDATAAALFNPGMSAWLALQWRGEVRGGETVLILGATGTAGQLAIQVAKLLGAKRVVAAGRNPEILATLPALGADSLINLEQAQDALTENFAREKKQSHFDVVVDYLWGPPTEALIAAVMQKGLENAAKRVRLVEVGESAGAKIALPAAVLRSSALEISGTGFGTAPVARIIETVPHLLDAAVRGKLQVGVERVPLAQVHEAWDRKDPRGRRLVFLP